MTEVSAWPHAIGEELHQQAKSSLSLIKECTVLEPKIYFKKIFLPEESLAWFNFSNILVFDEDVPLSLDQGSIVLVLERN